MPAEISVFSAKSLFFISFCILYTVMGSSVFIYSLSLRTALPPSSPHADAIFPLPVGGTVPCVGGMGVDQGHSFLPSLHRRSVHRSFDLYLDIQQTPNIGALQ